MQDDEMKIDEVATLEKTLSQVNLVTSVHKRKNCEGNLYYCFICNKTKCVFCRNRSRECNSCKNMICKKCSIVDWDVYEDDETGKQYGYNFDLCKKCAGVETEEINTIAASFEIDGIRANMDIRSKAIISNPEIMCLKCVKLIENSTTRCLSCEKRVCSNCDYVGNGYEDGTPEYVCRECLKEYAG